MKKQGIGSHQSASAGKTEWITPPSLLKQLSNFDFDLDPCSSVNHPWPIGKRQFTIEDDGLVSDWKQDLVFVNPPYGDESASWLQKLSKHQRGGLALIFARTETKTFFEHVWNKAHAVLFIEGRLTFHHISGERASANSGAPSVLIAYGHESMEKLYDSGVKGKFIQLITDF